MLGFFGGVCLVGGVFLFFFFFSCVLSSAEKP